MKRKNAGFLAVLFLILSMLAGCSALSDLAVKADPNPSVSMAESLQIEEGKLNVVFIDVGQGDSIFVISPDGKTMLIDAGEKENAQTVIDTIKACGKEKIDILVGTHPHSDHIGALAEVMQAVPVEKIYMPKASNNTKTFENLLTVIKEQGLKVTAAKAGISEMLGEDVTLSFLAPVADSYENTNNYSAVIKITYQDTSFLFTGDAERLVEKELLEGGADVKADVLKLGHHGSKTSTSKKFLDAVDPNMAVIEVGAGNSYNHPTEEVLKRVEKKEIPIYRTDLNGTVVVTSDGETLAVTVSKTEEAPDGADN